MADAAFVKHLNLIIALDGDVTSDEDVAAVVRHFSKVMGISRATVEWTVESGKITRLAVSDAHDIAKMVEVDISDPDFAAALETLANIDTQYPALEGAEPLVFWGDVPV